MADIKRLKNFVRNFKENGVKMMLEHPRNVREMLEIISRDWAARIDFSKLEHDQTTYVRRDFRHIESDLVFRAPLFGPGGRRLRKDLVIFILIEHQSNPDPLMSLRLTEYVLQILGFQVRRWSET